MGQSAGWGLEGGGHNQGSPGLCSHGPIYLLLPKLGFSCIRIEPGAESWDLGKADVKTEVWSSLGLVTQEKYMQGVGLAPRTLGPEVRELCSGQPFDFNIENNKQVTPTPRPLS